MRLLCGCLLFCAMALGQSFTQRGFLETRYTVYPQTAPGDSGRFIGEALLQWEPSFKLAPWLRLAGSFDARADTHNQVERRWHASLEDRERQRPAFAVRRLSAILSRGAFTFEAGRQFIRWGKADLLNPTDRFAPRDYLSVVDNDFLAVTAARATYETRGNTIDLVWAPRFTPSRLPLLNQRWAALPRDVLITESTPRYPGASQFGARFNRVGSGYECSLSFYEGFQHLPLFDAKLAPPQVVAERFYPKMRMIGGDAAIPLGWLTLKAEAAYFASPDRRADEYAQYVVQLERQAGEWFLVGGYAGEIVTEARRPLGFAPDRGLTRAFVGRAGYTIDARRSLSFEAALRQTGDGAWVRFEYSHLLGQHWRATAAAALVRGSTDDFLGQYRRNSHATLTIRYSF
jgi:hypothetical protein